jgi:hypothetical protein
MEETLLSALQQRREDIRMRWDALMRLERADTALANPDTLAFLFDQTLDEVLAKLPGKPVAPIRRRPTCQCGGNPMRVYFPALEQALLETLILVQTEMPELAPRARIDSVTELCTTLRRIARREIAVFDEICQQHPAGRSTEYSI